MCNFRTVAGGLLTVNSGMALQKCCSRQDFQETFEKVVLPSSNKLIEISNGSVRFTVESENLIALKELWEIYKGGTLQSRLQEFLVTNEIKKLANGEDIEVTVFIDEHEYNEAYFNLFLLHRGMLVMIKGSHMPCKYWLVFGKLPRTCQNVNVVYKCISIGQVNLDGSGTTGKLSNT